MTPTRRGLPSSVAILSSRGGVRDAHWHNVRRWMDRKETTPRHIYPPRADYGAVIMVWCVAVFLWVGLTVTHCAPDVRPTSAIRGK